MALTKFPTDLESYHAMMEHVAKVTKSIDHGNNGDRFCTISQSHDPIPKWDLKEFTTGQKYSFKDLREKQLLAAVDVDEDKMFVRGPRNESSVNASFFILKKAEQSNGSFDAIRAAKQEGLETGRVVLSWIAKFMELNSAHGVFIDAKSMNESAGPINGMYGYRFFFSWKINKKVCFHSDDYTEQPNEL